MIVIFHNVTISIEAADEHEAYANLGGMLDQESHSWSSDQYTTDDQPDIFYDTEDLLPYDRKG